MDEQVLNTKYHVKINKYGSSMIFKDQGNVNMLYQVKVVTKDRKYKHALVKHSIMDNTSTQGTRKRKHLKFWYDRFQMSYKMLRHLI